SGSLKDLEIIQEEDTHPSIDTSLNHKEGDLEIDEPQSDIIPIRRSTRTRQAPDRMCLYIDVEEHELGDLGEPANYKAALLDPKSQKWLNAMNVKMQSMKDNKVWVLVEVPPNGKTVGIKWLFKKKIDGWSGKAAYIHGIKIYRDRSRRLIGLCQSTYIEKILKRFCMENSKRGSIPMEEKLKLSKSQGASTPAELKHMQNVPYALAVGSIMYAVRCTHPDVAFAQNVTSRFQQNPGDLHWTTVKNIPNGAVDWKSAKQSIFATSSAEAEYIAAFDASKEAVRVRKFIYGLGVVPTIEEPISMYCDNTREIAIANESGITKDDNLAEPFTKALALPKYSEHTRNIGMLSARSLMYYRINLSELSVIAAAKVSHFEILCRVHGIEPTVGLFRCFYANSKSKGWMSFNPFPKSTEFSVDDYAVLVAHPTPFRKFLEPFLSLIGMSVIILWMKILIPFFLMMMEWVDPTKVKVGERKHVEEEARLLDFTVGPVVPLLPVVPARAESELEASVKRLFDKGGSTDQGDSAAGGGQDTSSGLVTRDKIIVSENVIVDKPKSPCKKRQVVTNANGSSHPPKKLMVDYGTSSEVATSGKSPSVLKELLVSSMLNVEADVVAVATLPMVTSLVSATLEHESGALADFITGLNLCTTDASERFVISSDSSHHSGTNASRAEDDYITRYAVVLPGMTEDSDPTEKMKADVVGPTYSARQDLSMGSQELDAKILHQVFVPQWNVLNDSFLDDYDARDEEIENLKAQLLLKETKAAKDAHLRTQVSSAEATDMIHTNEIDALKQRNMYFENEKESLNGKVIELQSLVSTKDLELKDLNVAVCMRWRPHVSLRDQVLGYERLKEKIEEFQDVKMILLMIMWQSWMLTFWKWLFTWRRNFTPTSLPLYLVGAISRFIEKEMQDGLSTDIDHGKADQVVLYETSLLFSLSVTHSRVERIRENVAAKRSALIGVWTLLVDLLSVENLVGESGTSNSMPTIIATTTSLSTTFASEISIPPITIEDYEVVGTDGPEEAQGNGQGNVASFPIVEFEKEELDTTPERDLPS
nr:hypothetical protein [Tanacetum cinerariifolium]